MPTEYGNHLLTQLNVSPNGAFFLGTGTGSTFLHLLDTVLVSSTILSLAYLVWDVYSEEKGIKTP